MRSPTFGKAEISSSRRKMGQTGLPQYPRPLQVTHFIPF